MNKFVLLALVAVFAVAAAQEINDIKFASSKNKTDSALARHMIGHANVSGNHSIARPNKTDRPNRPNKTRGMNPRGGFQDEESSEASFFTDEIEDYLSAKLNNSKKTNKTNRTDKKNKTNRTEKKNRTNKTGLLDTIKKWFSAEEEADAEEIEDLSLAQKNRTKPNKTNLTNKKNKTNRTDKKNKTNKTGLLETIKKWFSAEEEEEVDAEEIEDVLLHLKNRTTPYGRNKTNRTDKKNKTNRTDKKNKTNKTGLLETIKRWFTAEEEEEELDAEEIEDFKSGQKNKTNRTIHSKSNKTNKTHRFGKKNKTNKTGLLDTIKRWFTVEVEQETAAVAEEDEYEYIYNEETEDYALGAKDGVTKSKGPKPDANSPSGPWLRNPKGANPKGANPKGPKQDANSPSGPWLRNPKGPNPKGPNPKGPKPDGPKPDRTKPKEPQSDETEPGPNFELVQF